MSETILNGEGSEVVDTPKLKEAVTKKQKPATKNEVVEEVVAKDHETVIENDEDVPTLDENKLDETVVVEQPTHEDSTEAPSAVKESSDFVLDADTLNADGGGR